MTVNSKVLDRSPASAAFSINVDDPLLLVGPGKAPLEDRPDELFRKELQTFGAFDDDDDLAIERRVRLAVLMRELKQFDTMLNARKDYANKIFSLILWWLVGVGVVLLLVGFKRFGFELDSKVLLTLIGGTTLNVLGIFTIVANYLFPKNGPAAFLSAFMKRTSDLAEISAAPVAKKGSRRKPPEPKAADSTDEAVAA